MTTPPETFGIGHVSARACDGRLTTDGRPRHPRPALAGLSILEIWAADYGVRDDRGRMTRLDLAPLLDAVAARYDGCHVCEEHHVARIVADPVMTTHTVGVALLSFNSAFSETPTTRIATQLGSGAAIAVTLRSVGLSAAVGVAEAMVEEERSDAVRAALGHLLPISWYGQPLSSTYPVENEDEREIVDGDAVILERLRARGQLPA